MTGRKSAFDLLAGPALAACLAMPVAAQTAAPETEESPQSLIEQGAALLLRGILSELAPQIDEMTRDMGDAMALMAPAMGDLARLVDDIEHYEMPERLENGDILIRRKADAPPPPPLGEGLKRFWGPQDEAEPTPDPDAPKLDL